MSGPPSYARVLEYQHFCADHGLVQLQTFITVDGRVWPGGLAPPKPQGRCSYDSTWIGPKESVVKCNARMDANLYSDINYVVYLALRGQEYDGA